MLSSVFRTVAIDLRGYNLSERPIGFSNYKVQDIVEDLRALIEHLSKCVVVKLLCHLNINESPFLPVSK